MSFKYWTLARLKALCAFLGALLTFATTVLPLPGDNTWWTGVAAVLTFVAVYGVPNIGYVRPVHSPHVAYSPSPDADGDGRDDATGRFLPKH